MKRENPGFTIKILLNVPGGLKRISDSVPDKLFRGINTGVCNTLQIPFFDSVLLPFGDQYNMKEYVRVMEKIQRRHRSGIDVSLSRCEPPFNIEPLRLLPRIKDHYHIKKSGYPGLFSIGFLTEYNGPLWNAVEGIGEMFYHSGIKNPDNYCYIKGEYCPEHFVPIMNVKAKDLKEVTEYLPIIVSPEVIGKQFLDSKQQFLKVSGFQIERKEWIRDFPIGKGIIDRIIN